MVNLRIGNGGLIMTIKSFLKYVEIQTKVASVIPFTLGSVFVLYRYGSFNALNFIIMFISLITFDMTTTAINNYIDFKKAYKKEGYGYEFHNAIVRDGIKEKTAAAIIYVLLSIAVIFGVLLTIRTSVVVLLIGALSFAVGIFYTFGPLPISRMPLGEAFSGFFMGFIIMFLAIFIHVENKTLVFLTYMNSVLSFNVNIKEVFYLFLLSVPAVGGIANIMLANNICDLEDDIANKRFTLPYYIGKKNALKLFAALYYIGFIDIIILVLLKIDPIWSLLALITFILVFKNIKIFQANPSKRETFVLAVKNLVIMNAVHILTIILGLITK